VKIWVDSSRPLEELVLGGVAKRLSEEGYEVVVTCRRGMEYAFGDFEECLVIGPPFKTPLLEVANELRLFEAVKGHHNDLICVSLASPEASRVAFGLRIPHIMLFDDALPRRELRLTLPLADLALSPSVVPRIEGMIEPNKHLEFKGYLELAAVDWLGISYSEEGEVRNLVGRSPTEAGALLISDLRVRGLVVSERRLGRFGALKGIPTLLNVTGGDLQVEGDMRGRGFPLYFNGEKLGDGLELKELRAKLSELEDPLNALLRALRRVEEGREKFINVR